MKTVLISSLLTIYSFLGFSQSGRIVLQINGCKNNIGVVQIGLYNSEDGFTEYDKSFKGGEVKAKKESVLYTLTSIPAGTYAIAIWHDENEDKILDTNMFGVPKEKYGFSHNKFGKFGPPDFEDVSFTVDGDKEISLTINMK